LFRTSRGWAIATGNRCGLRQSDGSWPDSDLPRCALFRRCQGISGR
jgi:hypothetical protein